MATFALLKYWVGQMPSGNLSYYRWRLRLATLLSADSWSRGLKEPNNYPTYFTKLPPNRRIYITTNNNIKSIDIFPYFSLKLFLRKIKHDKDFLLIIFFWRTVIFLENRRFFLHVSGRPIIFLFCWLLDERGTDWLQTFFFGRAIHISIMKNVKMLHKGKRRLQRTL